MEEENLLEFLNKNKTLYALEYAVCNSELINFLDLISMEEEFTKRINLGVIYIS